MTARPRCLSRDQVRRFDRVAIERFGMNSLVLMENAARGATDVLESANSGSALPGAMANVFCGPGNNGGDGLAIARHLHIRGWRVTVHCTHAPEKFSPDARANLEILEKTSVPIEVGCLEKPEFLPSLAIPSGWIVDAILGTGARGPLRGGLAALVSCLNRQPASRFAVDIPTGLDCDATDLAADRPACFQATETATFVARKPVMDTRAGLSGCGTITIVDIGAPPETFQFL